MKNDIKVYANRQACQGSLWKNSLWRYNFR